MQWLDLLVHRLPPSALDRARQLAAAQREALELKRRRDKLAAQQEPPRKTSNPDKTVPRRPIGVRGRRGAQFAVGWIAASTYGDGNSDYYVLSGDLSQGIAAPVVLNYPNTPTPPFEVVITQEAIPGVQPEISYAYQTYAALLTQKTSATICFPVAETTMIVSVYKTAYKRIVWEQWRYLYTGPGDLTPTYQQGDDVEYFETLCKSYLVAPNSVREISTPPGVSGKLDLWGGTLTTSYQPVNNQLPNGSGGWIPVPGPGSLTLSDDGTGFPSPYIPGYGIVDVSFEAPLTQGWVVATSSTRGGAAGSPAIYAAFNHGLTSQSIATHESMTAALAGAGGWTPDFFLSADNASGLWSVAESVPEVAGKESLVKATESLPLGPIDAMGTATEYEDISEDPELVTVAEPSVYEPEGGRQSDSVDPCIAWDGGDPDYCQAQLFALGFTQEDLAP